MVSHFSSERRFMTARVEKRAVDFREISFIDWKQECRQSVI